MWFGKSWLEECTFKRGRLGSKAFYLYCYLILILCGKKRHPGCVVACVKWNNEISTAPASTTLFDISTTVTFQISWQILPQRERTSMGTEKEWNLTSKDNASLSGAGEIKSLNMGTLRYSTWRYISSAGILQISLSKISPLSVFHKHYVQH